MNLKPFGLRIPPELRQWIADRAKDEGRSMNAEILQLIKVAKRSQDSEAT